MVGPAPSVYDGAAYAEYLRAIHTIAFTRILLDQGVYLSMMIFAAGFRHLVRDERAEYEWLGTLLFGTGEHDERTNTGLAQAANRLCRIVAQFVT